MDLLHAYQQELAAFPGRRKELERVTRYSLYPTMFYRTNLWGHSWRVACLVEEINKTAVSVLGPEYDAAKALLLALVHDDAETVTGDYQSSVKAKMSQEELAHIHELEAAAIEELIKRYPAKVGGYAYADLLRESLEEATLEYEVMTFADKFDGFGEALHELWAGNESFITPVTNEYGTLVLPHDYYLRYFATFPGKHPRLAPLLAERTWFTAMPTPYAFVETCRKGRPHTRESLDAPTGYAWYDNWREVLMRRASEEQLIEFYTKKEGL